MSQWIDQYCGGQYTDVQNCFWWFRKIQQEQFGREVLPCCVASEQALERKQWRSVAVPAIGDAVWMKNNERIRHIGTWSGTGVLHAIEQAGVVHDSLTHLRTAGWEILGFETK